MTCIKVISFSCNLLIIAMNGMDGIVGLVLTYGMVVWWWGNGLLDCWLDWLVGMRLAGLTRKNDGGERGGV